ncbi:hypothetical protein GCM10010156_22770 [Planobispora rosea]|uniref:Uncharacterized protein n=1 Tax=Planobispora rosea TaxID=35762 RepID=A0A8J3S207_PLARO|nr:hypothetical protein [Planobispora rosea]GGS63282.1 hypothetical protein GCM10010156_22770 [Planobispora rosea]GIH84441.1 hypothetical protein Pro02_28490 [Planobispora rosea]
MFSAEPSSPTQRFILQATGSPVQPRIRFHSTLDRYCGRKWPENLASDYCPKDRTIVFQLTDGLVKNPSKLFEAVSIGCEYAHHVQQLSGIQRAYGKLPRRGGADRAGPPPRPAGGVPRRRLRPQRLEAPESA